MKGAQIVGAVFHVRLQKCKFGTGCPNTTRLALGMLVTDHEDLMGAALCPEHMAEAFANLDVAYGKRKRRSA